MIRVTVKGDSNIKDTTVAEYSSQIKMGSSMKLLLLMVTLTLFSVKMKFVGAFLHYLRNDIPMSTTNKIICTSTCTYNLNRKLSQSKCIFTSTSTAINMNSMNMNSATAGNLTQALVQQCNTVSDAMVLLTHAQKLREEASILQTQLEIAKEERLEKQYTKVDALIDSLLFHGITTSASNDDNEGNNESEQQRSKVELLQTEEQVAQLLISKRLDYDMVNLMFDRIVELSNRPQSIDSCSPLLSLLLDAVDKVDCLEREENPNKRWHRTVEKDLRRKLFALGYGIRIEDVNREKSAPRSITGDRDLY